MRRGWSAVAGVLLLAGCTSAGHVAARNDPVRRAFDARPAGTDCGSARMRQGTQRLPANVLDCVQHARAAGHPADAAVTAPTTEGDPITTHYRLLASGTFAIYTDGTKDKFGAGDWSFSTAACADRDPIVAQLCASP